MDYKFKSKTSNVNIEYAFTNETTVGDIVHLLTSLNSNDVMWMSNLFSNSAIHDLHVGREVNEWNYQLCRLVCDPHNGEILPTSFTIMLKDSQVSGYRIDVEVEGIKSDSAVSVRGTVFYSKIE